MTLATESISNVKEINYQKILNMSVINANPTVYDVSLLPTRNPKPTKSSAIDELGLYKLSLDEKEYTDSSSDSDSDSDSEEPIDELEIYDLIAKISDPEHPLSLAALGVVNLKDISIDYLDPSIKELALVTVKITPTINHCSLATLIGLGIRVRLQRCLPPRFRIRILLKEGSHQSEAQVNKQLNDKERICAACENSQLLSVISTMLATC